MKTVGAGTVVGRGMSIFMVVERGRSFLGTPAYALADLNTGEYLSLDVTEEALFDILKVAKFEVLAPSVHVYFKSGVY